MKSGRDDPESPEPVKVQQHSPLHCRTLTSSSIHRRIYVCDAGFHHRPLYSSLISTTCITARLLLA
jgi:hypothetical protein